jgi:hypothetical protein
MHIINPRSVAKNLKNRDIVNIEINQINKWSREISKTLRKSLSQR